MTGMGEYDASKPSEPLATINCIEKAICITLDWYSIKLAMLCGILSSNLNRLKRFAMMSCDGTNGVISSTLSDYKHAPSVSMDSSSFR